MCSDAGTCEFAKFASDHDFKTQKANPNVGGWDKETSEARCFCDPDRYGPSCDKQCKPACSKHGHCMYDTDAKEAFCFCNQGYSGGDCSTVGGSSQRQVFGGGNPVAVAFCFILSTLLLVGWVIHRNSHGHSLNPFADILYDTAPELGYQSV